jgi:hypothetical protein
MIEHDDFKLDRHQLRHCEPTGRRVAPPDDRLREAIQGRANNLSLALDCFVASLLATTTM